ncbi:4Fe-4S dicluster domain-containing protein [Candidatus Parcubacteria bacterium]|nr:MAG: 4Fe-4S dicluster domain-containing protein [Candidatus Parcubacteria bacterium]
MKRKIIQIDEDKCTGCGLCVGVCAEAALEIVDGKAKLVKDFYCDGMGACLDVCPTGALKIVEKEVADYDPLKTYEHVKRVRGEEAAKQVHGIDEVKHSAHSAVGAGMQCGCPGSMMRDFRHRQAEADAPPFSSAKESALRQWPVQLRLVSPVAPYFKEAELLMCADCVPFALADFHQRFLSGRSVAIFCPKLDFAQEEYLEKLTQIFLYQNPRSVLVLRMEVPCCRGVEMLVRQAMAKAQKDIPLEVKVISIEGKELSRQQIV